MPNQYFAIHGLMVRVINARDLSTSLLLQIADEYCSHFPQSMANAENQSVSHIEKLVVNHPYCIVRHVRSFVILKLALLLWMKLLLSLYTLLVLMLKCEILNENRCMESIKSIWTGTCFCALLNAQHEQYSASTILTVCASMLNGRIILR